MPPSPTFLLVRVGSVLERVDFDHLILVKAERNNALLKTYERNLQALASIKSFEKRLPDQNFTRVHRSFLVAIHQIKQVKDNTIELLTGEFIPIGSRYKKKFMEAIRHRIL
ncbi:LytTr DNA-binding domain-containing protein [Catalinimonas alkaloidigena]|uniref:LytTr DNA-binding domain-containing protein n=1 Tax=Catalinimonas alkaloidigena TaxID=1075417 RepID=A0A1G9U5N0_9BACT|nr:LytTR family DNA-binding domain-containing protein [Catalinimonas alkaloidigena]SDM54875.1 LytTr DNA-binding domain-containing protein [Catalinimonas alkaloidigena]